MGTSFEIEFEISKEDIKFSAAHFTIFPDGTRERLHGHNYRVRLFAAYDVSADGMAIDYGELKRALRKVASRYDEYLLLPARSRHLQLREEGPSIEASIGGARFVFPAEDVIVLPVENITGEALATQVRDDFLGELASRGLPLPKRCRIGIGSGDGQWVTRGDHP